MPELPEVETICWRLREGGHGEPPLVGRAIIDVVVADPAVVDGDRAAFTDGLRGARVRDVWRRAKWIVVEADDVDGRRRRVLVHLKMTGDLHVRAGGDAPRFERFGWMLDDGTRLSFTDPRRFGHVELLPPGDDVTAHFHDLGPEPLDDTFSARALRARLTGRRPIKATLLDQAVVAGVGNIYADESLWLAKLHPATPTNRLSDDDVIRLHKGIRRALRESIVASKESLAWRYENRAAPSPFRVYDRGGGPCLRCGTTLSTTTVAGRTTVFCPQCQPAP
jgi:formamidopyrimidine-DNA glycosylase